jgi:hypothetical protein
MRKSNTKEFIEKARRKHGDKYNYSICEYTGVFNTVCIICPKHKEFHQTPHHHLRGEGCPECGGKRKSNTEEFIAKVREKHHNRYDYSMVKYTNHY